MTQINRVNWDFQSVNSYSKSQNAFAIYFNVPIRTEDHNYTLTQHVSVAKKDHHST